MRNDRSDWKRKRQMLLLNSPFVNQDNLVQPIIKIIESGYSINKQADKASNPSQRLLLCSLQSLVVLCISIHHRGIPPRTTRSATVSSRSQYVSHVPWTRTTNYSDSPANASATDSNAATSESGLICLQSCLRGWTAEGRSTVSQSQ